MSPAVFASSSYRKINRQFPVTVILQKPFKAPFSHLIQVVGCLQREEKLA